MKAISAPLLALLNSNSAFGKADLYTWTFSDGTVLRTTDLDQSITTGGFTFATCLPAMERTKVTLKVGVEADSIDIMVLPNTTDMVNGFTWQNAARLGYLDGATVLVETAYFQSFPTIIGTLHVFQGMVSDVSPERTAVKVTVKSDLELLAQPFPRNVYQSVCLHTLYDSGCAVSRAASTGAGTVASGPTFNSFVSSFSPSSGDGAYDMGVLTFTSGALNGIRRTVKRYQAATFYFALPLPAAPSVGDTFTATFGCDKTLATCRSKFNNAGKFRGFPWVPNPETAAPPVPGYTKSGGK